METEIQTGTVATSAGLVARLERRLDQSRSFGRDVDTLFKQLVATLTARAPAGPTEQLDLALRAFIVSSQWAEQAEHPSRAIRVSAEVALTQIYRGLVRLGDDATSLADALVSAWSWAATVPRDVVTDVLVDGATPQVRRAISTVATRRAHLLRHDVSGVLDAKQDGRAGTASLREYTLLLARLAARDGGLERAVDLLADAPMSDPRVSLTFATIYCECGEVEQAVDRLKRCLVVAPERRGVRERLLEIYLGESDVELAIEQLIRALHESGDIFYWELLCDILVALDPARLDRVTDNLREESPALFVEVLIAQGSVDDVVRASRAKTFSHEQLWRIGNFLSEHGNRKAARVFERAILLQGAVAQSKVECADLGQRIENVIPFFESIDRPTKLRRLASDLMAKNKNNIPMRREFERVFGADFK